ncbi:YodC family protein [Marinoscillum sp.]|uniref:YodC family protein n=1 Tax=Marinoscillum sp. TaxID=2024838 RepID=UPI003BAC56A0
MLRKFKIGDRVKLKSGNGPTMVVKEYEPQDGAEVTCQWFDNSDKLYEKSFHQDTLDFPVQAPSVFSGNSKNKYRF